MRQLVAQNLPDVPIQSETVIHVCPYTQFDRLAGIHIQAQKVRLLMRGKFGQYANSELVLLHDVQNSRICSKFGKH